MRVVGNRTLMLFLESGKFLNIMWKNHVKRCIVLYSFAESV